MIASDAPVAQQRQSRAKQYVASRARGQLARARCLGFCAQPSPISDGLHPSIDLRDPGPWRLSPAKPSTAHPSVLPLRGRGRRASRPIGWRSRPGINACSPSRGPPQPSPTLGDALNAGYGYLEVRCLGCDTHQAVALDVIRRAKTTPIHELERYMRCKDCSRLQGYRYKRSHLVALRMTKISASDPASTWWPGER